jgi:acyl-CoA dehydrogenase
MDTVGNKGAQDLIAMIKIVAPNMALDVMDRAMQIHGAVGLSQDTPLAHMWAYARTLRLADGPDQVHMMQLGRNLARRQEAGS